MLKSCDCVLGALLRRWQRPVGEFEGSERIGDGHQRTANGQGNSQARRRSREQLPGLFGLHVKELHVRHWILHLLFNIQNALVKRLRTFGFVEPVSII